MRDDWTPRPNAWTIHLNLSGSPVQNHGEYTAWMTALRATIGAKVSPYPNYHQTEFPWALKTTPYGTWQTDHFGQPRFDRTPRAVVWQNIEGQVVSAAMAHVWAALHLVAPLEDAGFTINLVGVELTDEMVLIG